MLRCTQQQNLIEMTNSMSKPPRRTAQLLGSDGLIGLLDTMPRVS